MPGVRTLVSDLVGAWALQLLQMDSHPQLHWDSLQGRAAVVIMSILTHDTCVTAPWVDDPGSSCHHHALCMWGARTQPKGSLVASVHTIYHRL